MRESSKNQYTAIMKLCQCPASAALASIPNVTCGVSSGQLQKVIFQRLRKADGTLNGFEAAGQQTALEVIKAKASWTALLSAEDGTKVVISPYINAPADAGGDAITSGSGNDVIGGIAEVVGRNPVTFSGQFRKQQQTVIAALKGLECEALADNLGIFPVFEGGIIEAVNDNGVYRPIPIRSFFVSDKIHGNFDAFDHNDVSWAYEPNYSDGLEVIEPDFNPLTELQNA